MGNAMAGAETGLADEKAGGPPADRPSFSTFTALAVATFVVLILPAFPGIPGARDAATEGCSHQVQL
jgi:hypothetical protein